MSSPPSLYPTIPKYDVTYSVLVLHVPTDEQQLPKPPSNAPDHQPSLRYYLPPNPKPPNIKFQLKLGGLPHSTPSKAIYISYICNQTCSTFSHVYHYFSLLHLDHGAYQPSQKCPDPYSHPINKTAAPSRNLFSSP